MLPLGMLLIPCIILNKLYGWDYCYTAGGIGTPLEIISCKVPPIVFLIFLYGSLTLFINFIFYKEHKRSSFRLAASFSMLLPAMINDFWDKLIG